MRAMGMLDDLAEEILTISGTGTRWSDAFGLAYKLSLDPCPVEGAGYRLVDSCTIEYDKDCVAAEQKLLVASGIAVWALGEWDMQATEARVRALAGRLVDLPPPAQHYSGGLLARLAPT